MSFSDYFRVKHSGKVFSGRDFQLHLSKSDLAKMKGQIEELIANLLISTFFGFGNFEFKSYFLYFIAQKLFSYTLFFK